METKSENIKVIRPSKSWSSINVGELIIYRDLIYFLVLRGIKAKYAQSVLGIGWAVIQPLVTTMVFTIVFGSLAKVTSDGVPYFIFSLTGMVPWQYFANTLTDSTNSLVVNSNMISKVYFPRLVLPLSSALTKLLDFSIGLVILVVCLVIFDIPFSVSLFILPLLIVILLLTSIGLGLILSSMAVQYRDVKHAMTFFVQLLMYAAPVVYPTSKIPDNYLFWYSLNPMVGVIEGFRSAILNTNEIPWAIITRGGVVSVILFVFGAFYFRKMEKIFADVI